jgi:hypothetical protein
MALTVGAGGAVTPMLTAGIAANACASAPERTKLMVTAPTGAVAV